MVSKYSFHCARFYLTRPSNLCDVLDGAESYARYYSDESNSSSSQNPKHVDGSSNMVNSTAEHDAVLQAAHDVNYIANNISNIARQLDTPAGLKGGVNATFNWLLNEEASKRYVDAAKSSTPPASPTQPTAFAQQPTTPGSSGVAAMMADAYRQVEETGVAGVGSPFSMMNELKR
jgi:hypothetical protein